MLVMWREIQVNTIMEMWIQCQRVPGELQVTYYGIAMKGSHG